MRPLALVLLVLPLVACKAKQNAAELQDDGLTPSAPAGACTTGFEATCTAEQLGALLLAATGEFVHKAETVADDVGVVSHVDAAEAASLALTDTEGDLNTLRGRLAELRAESSITSVAAAQASIGDLTALVDKIEALVNRLAEVKRAAGATPDAAVAAQITLLDRQVAVLLQRVRAAKAAAVTAQTYEIALWVTPHHSFADVQARLSRLTGVSEVSGDRRKGYLTYKVLSANYTASLQAMRSYYDNSFYKSTFLERGYDKWSAWRITYNSRCEFASAWISIHATCLTLSRYGVVSRDLTPDDRLACKVHQADPNLTLRTWEGIENPASAVIGKIEHNRCGHDWEYPLH